MAIAQIQLIQWDRMECDINTLFTNCFAVMLV